MSKKYLFPAAIIMVCFVAVIGFALPGSMLERNDSNDSPKEGYANPAAVYCIDQGYDYELVTTDVGVVGMCKFPDGTSCDEWDFLAGKCGTEHSYCAQEGLLTEVKADGANPFTKEYAVCVSEEGGEVGSVSQLSNLEEKSIKVVDPEGSEALVSPEANQAPETDEEYAEEDFEEVEAAALPASFDWRTQTAGNYLTNVKNQGQCGSCWAFSAVGVAEAALNIANQSVGNNYDLSEQYLVSDCNSDTKYGYQNCRGGWKDKALTFIKKDGLPDESCMAYVDGNDATGCGFYSNGACMENCSYAYGVHCSDCVCGDRCNDWLSRTKNLLKVGKVSKKQTSIKNALIKNGPLSASLRMNGYFDGGIYRCVVDTPTNHAIDIVGFNDVGGYWIVRNSWGPTWDTDGYFNVGYGECAIESSVYYATALSDGPTLLSPSRTISATMPTYTWEAMPGIEKYNIEVRSGSSKKLGKTYLASEICNASECSVTQPKALKTSVYTWKVKAYANKKWTGWSAPKTFIVATRGIDSSFNTKVDSYGWKNIQGSWQNNSSLYYRTLGVKNKTSSVEYTPEKYADMVYEARMIRYGCSGCANRLIIQGDSKPLRSDGGWNQSYLFQYTNNGSFSVWATTKTTSRALKNWTTSSAINDEGWNTLRVEANGGAMSFYINNVLVWSGYDAAFTEGNVGIGMYRDTSSGNEFYVDWAELSVIYGPDAMEASEAMEAAAAAAETIDPSQIILEGGDENTSP